MIIKRFLALLAVCGFAFAVPVTAHAFDEFDATHAPARFSIDATEDIGLDIKGRMRISLHDLQGEGGPGYDSPTDTATIGTRSPFVALDSFELSFRGHWKDLLWINANVAFLTDDTYLSAIYFEYKSELTDWFSQGVEIGYQNSIVATNRHTVRYPLIATNYWRNSEYHVAYGGKFNLAKDTSIALYASLGMMRPLKSEPIHGSSVYKGTFSTLAYGPAQAFSGNSPTGTALLRFYTHGFDLDLFGFVGELTTQYGIHTLISDFTYYRLDPDFDANETEALAYWYGGRLSYEFEGFHIMGEVIASHEHLLDRVGMYVQAGYNWTRDGAFWVNEIEFVARYEQTWLLHSTELFDEKHALRSPETNNAITWDYKILTLALKADIVSDFVALRLEYSLIWEENGVPALDIASEEISNNEFLLQIEARY